MSEDVVPLAGQPRVLYLYKGVEGQPMVFAVKQDLALMLNFAETRPALVAPQTPEPVRRMLYTKHFYTRERKTYLERVVLHRTPSGLRFFEVWLSPDGVTYLEARHSGRRRDSVKTFNVFEAYGPWPETPTTRPASRLKEALTYLGYTPNS